MGRGRTSTFSFGSSSSKPKEDFSSVEVTQTGLINLGNSCVLIPDCPHAYPDTHQSPCSCFYNTVLQALSVSQPLYDIIAHPPDSSPALKAISPRSDSAINNDELLSPLPISIALVNTLERLSTNGKRSFNPKVLLRELSNKYEEYAHATQQDSHELLRHLIDSVMMEEVDYIKKVPKPELRPNSKRRYTIIASPSSNGLSLSTPRSETDTKDVSGEEDEDGYASSDSSSSLSSSSSSGPDEDDDDEDGSPRPINALKKRKKKPKSLYRPFIDQVFGGKLASLVVCEECKHVSLIYEDFMDVSLSMRDESASRMRKRDRIRKSLQSGFFSRKSTDSKRKSSVSSAGASSASEKPSMPPLVRHESTSLSEAEASPSQSEAEPDEDDPIARKSRSSRRKSLDPSNLRESKKPLWITRASGPSDPKSRDSSPLGRAASVASSRLSSSSTRSKRHSKPKIPEASPEQMAWIRRALAEVPGPTPTLPTGLRVAIPPGEKSVSQSSIDSSDQSAARSFESLKLHNDLAEQMDTDLYECLRQFTAVEVLEGDNAFACHNCWRLLNPELAQKRREEKEAKRIARRTARAQKRNAAAPSENNHSARQAVQQADEDDLADGAMTPTQASEVSTKDDGRKRPDIDIKIDTASTPTDGEHERLSPASPSASFIPPSPLNPNPLQLAASPSNASLTSSKSSASAVDYSTDDERSIASDTMPSKTAPLTHANVGTLSGKSANGDKKVAAARAPSVSTRASHETASTNQSRAMVQSNASATPSAALKEHRYIHRRAHKRYLFSAASLPPVLVMHFKRFQQTSRSLFGSAFTNLKKRDDEMTFSEDLDLTPFLAPPGRPPRSHDTRQDAQPSKWHLPHFSQHHSSNLGPQHHHHRILGHRSADTLQNGYSPGTAKYRLFAVIEHIGNLAMGHYVAYVLSDRAKERVPSTAVSGEDNGGSGSNSKRGRMHSTSEIDDLLAHPEKAAESSKKSGRPPKRWMYTSDDEVRPCSVDEVLKSKAYMLFYERVEPEAPKSRI